MEDKSKTFVVDTGWAIDSFNQIDILEINMSGEAEVYTGSYEITEEILYLDNAGNKEAETNPWYTYYAKVKVGETELEFYNREREWDEVSEFYLKQAQNKIENQSDEQWITEKQAEQRGIEIRKIASFLELE